MRTKNKAKKIFKPLKERASQAEKDKIRDFFNKVPFIHSKVCKELKIPQRALYTVRKTNGQDYISKDVADKLLTYIEQWQQKQ
jgi:hypothetical protein